MSLLWLSSRRHLAAHRWQFGLSILGVALGVAVVVSVDLANESAHRGFELSTEAVTGSTTHQVLGGPSGLPEDLYRMIRIDLAIRRVAPVVEGFVTVGGDPGNPSDPPRVLRVLGVDPLSEAPFRARLETGPAELDLSLFLTTPGAGLLSRRTAAELGVQPGTALEARVGPGRARLVVAALLGMDDDDSEAAIADLFVTDISSAQELFGMEGRLSRLDLVFAADEGGRRALARLQNALPPDATLAEAAARTETTLQMTRAFRVNLAALSLLALMCGVFLVYNTMSFSVVQRRPMISMLRAVGVTRREVFQVVLAEAAVIGVIGTLLGMLGGIFIGSFLVHLVTRTINDLYFVVSVRELSVAPSSLLKGVFLGVGWTLIAALAPAVEATSAPPRAVLMRSHIEARARRNVGRLAGLGVVLLIAGAMLLAVAQRNLVLSFAALFLTVLGFALLTPGAVVVTMRAATPLMTLAFGPLGRIATRGVVASLSRTAVAVAALMIAVSVIIGVGVMIDSFRGTVVRWLDNVLAADLYIAPPGTRSLPGNLTLDAETVAALGDIPGIERISTLRGVDLPEPGGGRTRLFVFDIDDRSRASFDIKEGDPEGAWASFASDDAVLLTEPFAYRRGLQVGDTVTLPTDSGARPFTVAGIYYNFASEEGLVAMSRATYARHWHDPTISGFSVYAADAADLAAIRTAIRTALGDRQVIIRSNRALRQASLEVFDRTFLITGVLRLLVTLVAFLGVLSALMSLQLERTKEIGVLRALGLTPREVWRLVVSQSGLMGVAAGCFALPVGLSLAALMIFVINRRSFGWTLNMSIAPGILLQAFALALIAALLAGLYPALHMSRTKPAAALREE